VRKDWEAVNKIAQLVSSLHVDSIVPPGQSSPKCLRHLGGFDFADDLP
jgi:hypothetical protein